LIDFVKKSMIYAQIARRHLRGFAGLVRDHHASGADLSGWLFDWSDQVQPAYMPFELTLGEDARIIGRVAQRITRYL